MTRDNRDPQKLGTSYLRVRALGLEIEDAAHLPCDDWADDGVMSSDPSDHHSKVKQDAPIESDGGG